LSCVVSINRRVRYPSVVAEQKATAGEEADELRDLEADCLLKGDVVGRHKVACETVASTEREQGHQTS
jgi:hypothetical protein